MRTVALPPAQLLAACHRTHRSTRDAYGGTLPTAGRAARPRHPMRSLHFFKQPPPRMNELFMEVTLQRQGRGRGRVKSSEFVSARTGASLIQRFFSSELEISGPYPFAHSEFASQFNGARVGILKIRQFVF